MVELNLYPFQLLDVRLYEATIKRSSPDGFDEADAGSEEQPSLAFTLRVKKQENRLISVFLNIEIKSLDQNRAQLVLDFTLEGVFEAQADFEEIDQSIWEEFNQQSSVSLLWPFAREYANEFFIRMRENLPLLPTFNRLSINLEEESNGSVLEEA
jgi:preprotein translocase subunit SecB